MPGSVPVVLVAYRTVRPVYTLEGAGSVTSARQFAGAPPPSTLRTSATRADAGSTVFTNSFELPAVLVMTLPDTAGVLALESCHRICFVCEPLVDRIRSEITYMPSPSATNDRKKYCSVRLSGSW